MCNDVLRRVTDLRIGVLRPFFPRVMVQDVENTGLQMGVLADFEFQRRIWSIFEQWGCMPPRKKGVVDRRLRFEGGVGFSDDTGFITDELDGEGLTNITRIRNVSPCPLISGIASKCIGKPGIKFL